MRYFHHNEHQPTALSVTALSVTAQHGFLALFPPEAKGKGNNSLLPNSRHVPVGKETEAQGGLWGKMSVWNVGTDKLLFLVPSGLIWDCPGVW